MVLKIVYWQGVYTLQYMSFQDIGIGIGKYTFGITPFSKRVWVFDEFMLEVIFHVRTISYHTCDINEERNWASFNLMTMDYSTIGCCTNRYNFIISL